MNTIIQEQVPTREDLLQTRERIKHLVHQTPVITSETLNKLVDGELFLKCENFQKVGAFKYRGACNAILSLDKDELKNGVATHSSGNHAQAIALAAKNAGVTSHIVMPKNSPSVKIEAVEDYGANIILCESTLESREATLEGVVAETGATFISPYNDYNIIAGQSTAAQELLEQATDLDAIITPVGGGGLLSGTALVAHYFSPGSKVYAGEPEGADDAFQSMELGEIVPNVNPDTIADGLRTTIGDKNFGIMRDHVNRILTVSDSEIIGAMKLLWERTKMVIEPSGAVPLAAILKNKEMFSGIRTGVILSGGNVDLSNLPF